MPTNTGTIAITARGDGSRWYGRISISMETAKLVNLKEGDRVSTKCVNNSIVIYPDENGRIKLPAARGKGVKRHAFEAATTTLGLKEIRLPQTDTETFIVDNQIYVAVPAEFMSDEETQKKRPRKKTTKNNSTIVAPKPIPAILRHENRIWGAAAAIVTEAGRSNRQVRPMRLHEIVSLLIEKEVDIVVAGPRFFKLNGKSVTVPDLLDEVNRVCGSTEQDRIALVMD